MSLQSLQSVRGVRRVLAVVMGVGLSVGVVSCSSDDSSGSTASSDVGQPDLMPAAEGKTQYPLTLETPWGRTELTARPEKVMATALSGFDAELLVALGVTPVAANMGLKNATYVRDAGGDRIGTVLDGTFHEMYPFEEMSNIRPDLIVNFGYDLTEDYGKLSDIAPVVSAEHSMDNYYNQPWQDMLRTLGKALDLSDRADKIIADNESLLEKVRDEHPEFSGKTAAFTIWRSGDLGLGGFKKGAPSEVFLRDIGFSEDALAERKPDGGTVSPEEYGIIDADALIVADSSEDDLATLTDNPLYKAVPAVKNGRVSYLARAEDKDRNSALAWAFALLGPIGTKYAVDNLVPKLMEALKAS